MSFELINNGDVLDEDYINNNLMKQANIVCTSGTRPSSPNEGMHIFETDTDSFLTYSGLGWEHDYTIGGTTSYTPVFSATVSGGTLGTGGTLLGRYKRLGKMCFTFGTLVFGTGATGGTGGFQVTLPFTAATITNHRAVGTGYFRDTSAGSTGHFQGISQFDSAATNLLFYSGQLVTSTGPFTWTSTDFFSWAIFYEIA